MKMTDLFSAQLEREVAISHRTLEKVPIGKPDWKPHEKSMPLGALASLVGSMPGWVAMAIQMNELDIAPVGEKPVRPPLPTTTKELLAAHDESAAKARAALEGTNDDFLLTPWKLLVGGKVVLENPRHVVIEDTFTHLAHHRGQLSVYLRLTGATVPSIYGPSADDPSF